LTSDNRGRPPVAYNRARSGELHIAIGRSSLRRVSAAGALARRNGQVNEALEIFINGIVGVYAAIAVLYLAMRALAFVAARLPAQEE